MPQSLTVDGMNCDGCEQTVEEALLGLKGIQSATADHEAGTVMVEGEAGVDDMIAAIEDAGYEASA